MLKWLLAARWLHAGVFILAAIGFVRFLFSTRFWLPKYIHWIAGIALLIGYGVVRVTPPEAPLNRGDWIWLKQALAVLLFPAIVYSAFVLHGGQRAAYEARRHSEAVPCPHCGTASGLQGQACGTCGQTLPEAAGNDRPTV